MGLVNHAGLKKKNNNQKPILSTIIVYWSDDWFQQNIITFLS